MTSPTKRVFNGFFPYDYRALEQSIRDMAKKGWRLDAVSRFSLTYKQTDTAGFAPHVEIFTGAYEEDHDKKLAQYLRSRKKDGWQFMGDVDFFYFWYVPEGARVRGPSPEAERNLSQRMVWSRELGALGITLVLLVMGLVSILRCVYTDFLTFTGLGSLLILPIFLLPALLIGFLILRGVLPQRDALRRGETLPVPDIRAARLRYLLLYGFLLAAAAFALLLFLSDAVFGYTRYLALVIPPLLAITAILFLQRLPDVRIRKTLVLCVILLAGAGMLLLQRWSPARPAAPADMSGVLTVQRVTGSPAERSYYRPTVSPAVPEHYVYTETDAGGVTAQNEYFRVPSPFWRRLVLSKVHAAMGRDGLTAGDPQAWQADEAWQASDGAVLLRRGSELFYYAASGTDAALTPGDLN